MMTIRDLRLLPLLLAVACRAHGEVPSHAGGEGCAVRTVFARAADFADGSGFFVQPGVLAAAGDDVLVAGRVSYLHTREPSGRLRSELTDTLLGTVFSGTGAASPVTSPIPARRIAVIRAAGRPDGRWDVVIGEQQRPTEGAQLQSDTLHRLWHGVYGRDGWSPLVEIPIPPGLVLGSDNPSALVRTGDTLSLAVMTVFGPPRDVVLFQHTSRWEAVHVRVRTASYVALVSSPQTGLVLAVTQRQVGGEQDLMALYAYHARRGWNRPQRVDGGHFPAQQPVFATSDAGVTLGWTVPAPDETSNRVFGWDDDGSVAESARLVDSLYASPRPVPLVGSGGTRVWIVDRGGSPAEPQLHVLHGPAADARLVGTLPNPFFSGLFRATATSPADFVLSGPLIRDSVPITHTIRARIDCP